MRDRSDITLEFYRLLNSPGGKLLMKELEQMCDPPTLFEENPYALAHAVGGRDVYKRLLEFQRGAETND
jgi:hypothetical protein